MPSTKAKIKAAAAATTTVNASPLKRRKNLAVNANANYCNGSKFPAVVAMSFKNSGVRRIVNQYSQVWNKVIQL